MLLHEQDKIYTPLPTLEKFHASNKIFRLVMGAVGSGKSSAMCAEVMRRMMETPVGKDGIRRARAVIVRDTYPNLQATTIKTWQYWFPPANFGKVKQSFPLNQKIEFFCGGAHCEFEVFFLALQSPQDVEKLRSLEATIIWFNEISGISQAVFEESLTRVGRYPALSSIPDKSKKDFWYGVIADSNYFSELSWHYFEFFELKNNKFDVFEQPPPILYDENGNLTENPCAENIENLPSGYDYYWRLARDAGRQRDTFKTLVLCQFGEAYSGKPVHKNYNELYHYANYSIEATKNNPLYLGFDFGNTPACVIAQYINGQLLVLDEIVTTDSNLEQLISVQLIPILSTQYVDKSLIIYSPCDPAGVKRAETDGNYCVQILAKHGLNPKPLHTNALSPRRGALSKMLDSLVNGQPSVLISNNCKMLNKGLKTGFHYPEVRAHGLIDVKYHDTPEKNIYSHICEALEYVALYLTQGAGAQKEIKAQHYVENGVSRIRYI